MVQAFLGIGGNLGYRQSNLRTVVRHLRQRVNVTAVSSLYETEPVGFKNQPKFLNAVVAVECDSEEPDDLHQLILEIEADLGRKRTFTNAPRTVDIDLLLFGEAQFDSDTLTVPHPRMHQRAFVMVPLSEIAADVSHPTFKRSIRELLDDLGDTSGSVTAIEGPSWVDRSPSGR